MRLVLLVLLSLLSQQLGASVAGLLFDDVGASAMVALRVVFSAAVLLLVLPAGPGAVLLATNATCPVQAYRVGTHLYAAQFHPEPTPRDFADRMTFYRTTGYFDPAQFDAVQQEVLAASVTEGAALLRRFAAASRVRSNRMPEGML